MKDLVILGRPNGAGKTTAAPHLLPAALGIREFVNADEIARGLSPFNPEGTAAAAARLMLERIRLLAQSGESLPLRRPVPAADTPGFYGCAMPRATVSFCCSFGCRPQT